MKNLVQMGDSLIACLASDHYSIHLVKASRSLFKISSQNKICFWGIIELSSAKQRKEKQKNTNLNQFQRYQKMLIVLDAKHQWVIYGLNRQQPVLLWTGKLMAEEFQIQPVVSVHLIDHKLVFFLQGFKVLYIDPRNNQTITKPFLPYGPAPLYEHHKFSALLGYLPQEESSILSCSCYVQNPDGDGLLLLSFFDQNSGTSGVYGLQFVRAVGDMASSKHTLLNILGKILIMQTLDKNFVVLQTTQALILWETHPESMTKIYSWKLRSFLNKNIKGELEGVTQQGKLVSITLDSNKKQLVRNFLSVKQVPADQQAFELSGSYLLTSTHQLYLFANPAVLVLNNMTTSLKKAQLFASQHHNFLIADKTKAEQHQTIIFGNQMFAYAGEHHYHGIMLKFTNILKVGRNKTGVQLYLSSTLIGMIKMTLSLRASKTTSTKEIKMPEIAMEVSPVNKNEETLFLNDNIQVAVSNIYRGNQTTSVQNIFEGNLQWLGAAQLVGDFLVLAAQDQLHIFDAKTLKRQYIYCCNGQVKNVYSLNGVNVIAVQSWAGVKQNSELLLLVLQQDSARKLQSIPIPQAVSFVSLTTTINTVLHQLSIFGSTILICSCDPLLKYQSDKVFVGIFQLPIPKSSFSTKQIISLQNFDFSMPNFDCLLVFREQSSQKTLLQSQIYIISFSPKYLQKDGGFQKLTYQVQRILLVSALPTDKLLTGILYRAQDGNQKVSQLVLLGQSSFSVFRLKFGRIDSNSLQDRSYFQRQIEKIISIPAQVMAMRSQISSLPSTIVPTLVNDTYLVYNIRELFYVRKLSSKLQVISYYSLINQAFMTLKNNLAASQVIDIDYLGLFSQKMVIKSVKYVSHNAIFLLFQSCIVVLQISQNGALVVRQELKFIAEQGPLQIQEFLQHYDQNSLFLRQKNGRIYILKENMQKNYQLLFHSNIDQDVSLLARVSLWQQPYRTYSIQDGRQPSRFQELIVKKDGQVILRKENSKEEEQSYVYL